MKRQDDCYKEALLNILPDYIVKEILQKKSVHPKVYRHSTIFFSDVVSFSRLAFHLDPVTLIRRLNTYITLHDRIMDEFGIEKIKTIGDSYMCVSGIPTKKKTHAVDCCLAALSLLKRLDEMRSDSKEVEGLDLNNWSFRIGIHTGPCISGVIGYKKYTFDIWGDSVNIASRMETASEPGRINISKPAYEEVKELFDCTYRGSHEVEKIGIVDMFFLDRIKPILSTDERGFMPNEDFIREYCRVFKVTDTYPQLKSLPQFIQNYIRQKPNVGGEQTMSENRVYPRIQSDWKLYLDSPEGKREVGFVKDISLSGASLQFVDEYGLVPGKHRFSLKLTNNQLEPAELVISGLKEWERREKNEVFLGIIIDRLNREKRTRFIQFLSRSDKLHAEATLLEE